MRKLKISILLAVAASFSSGCDTGVKTLGAGEYGVLFQRLPVFLGGGVSDTVVQPGELQIIWPFQKLLIVDTSLQTIGWGGLGQGNAQGSEDYVETRTVDGNEVGLAIEVQYRVNPEKVAHVVQKVGDTKEKIEHLIAAVSRADIRTHMNSLTTSDYFVQEKRDAAVQKVKAAMAARLEPEGIKIERVIFRDYKFERAGVEGQPADRSYQQQIDETQAKLQEAEQEEKRRAALIEAKGQDIAKQDGERKRTVAWANGYKRQAQLRGEGYLKAKQNESERIKAVGINEIEALKKKISALSGPGGEAILRLEIAKSLAEAQPKFILLNSSGDGATGIGLNKVDTNELIRQVGIAAAVSESKVEKLQPSEPNVSADSANSAEAKRE